MELWGVFAGAVLAFAWGAALALMPIGEWRRFALPIGCVLVAGAVTGVTAALGGQDQQAAADPAPAVTATETVTEQVTVAATGPPAAGAEATAGATPDSPESPDARGPVLVREAELALAPDELWDVDAWEAKPLQYQGADVTTYTVEGRHYLEPAPPATMAPAASGPDLATCADAPDYSGEAVPVAPDQAVCLRTTDRNLATLVVRRLGAEGEPVTLAVTVWEP